MAGQGRFAPLMSSGLNAANKASVSAPGVQLSWISLTGPTLWTPPLPALVPFFG